MIDSPIVWFVLMLHTSTGCTRAPPSLWMDVMTPFRLQLRKTAAYMLVCERVIKAVSLL